MCSYVGSELIFDLLNLLNSSEILYEKKKINVSTTKYLPCCASPTECQRD